jgi:U3 small nucleolar RNA-associated protein 15
MIKTMLTEIKHRAGFPETFRNRSPETLLPILEWMHKWVTDPRYTAIIIDIMYEILETYGADLLEDGKIAYVVEGITRRIQREIEQAEKSQHLIGLLEMITQAT